MKAKYQQPGIGKQILHIAPYVLLVAASIAAIAMAYWLMGPIGYWSLGLLVAFGVYRIEGRRRSKLRDAIEHPPAGDQSTRCR